MLNRFCICFLKCIKEISNKPKQSPLSTYRILKQEVESNENPEPIIDINQEFF